MARIGFIGTGEIASAMVEGIAGEGHEIRVSQRSAKTAATLAAKFAEVSVCSNEQVVEGSDYVILCLMSDVAGAVLADLPFRADQHVISAMGETSHAELQRLCAPATDLVKAIPLPSIASGGCPLPVFPNPVSVQAIFGDKNPVITVSSESGLAAYLGGCATSLPMLELIRHARDWLAAETGDAAGAEAYLSAMFAAQFGDIARAGPGRLAEAIKALSLPGGFNATLRDAMADHGAPDQLVAALDGLKPRLGLSEK